MNETALVTILVFVAISVVAVAAGMIVRDLFRSRSERIRRRLDVDVPLSPSKELPSDELTTSESGFSALVDRLALQAGTQLSGRAVILAAVCAGLLVGGPLFLWREDLLSGGVGFLVGSVLVMGLLVLVRARRKRLILNQLPDAMDYLSRAVRAGESLDQAIGTLGRTGVGPVAAEFRVCAQQLGMGLSMDAAMRGMAVRVPLTETEILATTLRVQRQTGGSLSFMLERLAGVFRDRLNYHRQFRAATATARGSAMVIIAVGLAAAVYVLTWRPDYVARALETLTGRVAFGAALLLMGIGVAWIFWLLRTDY